MAAVSAPFVVEMEGDWGQFEDPTDVDAGGCWSVGTEPTHGVPYHVPLEEPLSTHPELTALSSTHRRVSSCYFSLASDQGSVVDAFSRMRTESESIVSDDESCVGEKDWQESGEPFYHDMLMNIFVFLDLPSLAAFSQTAKRPNFEVYYFLKLQLERAILPDPSFATEDEPTPLKSKKQGSVDCLPSFGRTSCLSRLARIDATQSQETVDEYIESNSASRARKLRLTLAYFMDVMQRSGVQGELEEVSSAAQAKAQAFAKAVLFVSVLGAASMVSGSADAASFAESVPTEVSNVIFRLGMGGALMGAARKMSEPERRVSMRETAEQMAKAAHELPRALMNNEFPTTFQLPTLAELLQMLTTTMTGNHGPPARKRARKDSPFPLLANPYDHLPSIEEEETGKDQRLPSGCVGAFSHAMERAASTVKSSIKERRKARFFALSDEDQLQLQEAFLEACSSDASLSIVKQMISSVDVDRFCPGPFGLETCALHTAAYNGAVKVIDFLCQGIDNAAGDGKTSAKEAPGDGGLCDINVRDSNGWTAVHFAAGVGSSPAIHALAAHGADLRVQANNGYKPVQWAERLSNDEAAETLKQLLGHDHANWMGGQALTDMANRFFSMIPTQ